VEQLAVTEGEQDCGSGVRWDGDQFSGRDAGRDPPLQQRTALIDGGA
jgi:hypothetical protein